MRKEIAVLGIDLGKNSCSLAGLDAGGAVVLRRRMRPETIARFTERLPACVVAMEACCGAHHLARLLAAQGHTIRLMSPEYVRPYVKAQKNDDRDAEAIAEAATRPTMRFVTPKTAEQLDLQTLHRVRDRLVSERTALINQLRAILLERGIRAPKGRSKLSRCLTEWFDDEEVDLPAALGPRMRDLVAALRAEWRTLDERIAAFDAEFAERVRQDDTARRLTSIPGFGPINATALAAAIGSGETFSRGRDLAAWLGLVPRQLSTGGRTRLAGISKRGNKYLRKQLVHGARSALPGLLRASTPLGAWLRGLMARMHKNAVVIALANKLARIAWAVLHHGDRFDAHGVDAAA